MVAPQDPPPDRSAELRALLDVLNEALALEGVAGTKRERIIHHVMFGVPAGSAALHGPPSRTWSWAARLSVRWRCSARSAR